jgi:hypothetical protein
MTVTSEFSSNFVCQSIIFHRLFVLENTVLQRYRHGGEPTRTLARHTKAPLNIDENETTTGSAANCDRGGAYCISYYMRAQLTCLLDRTASRRDAYTVLRSTQAWQSVAHKR